MLFELVVFGWSKKGFRDNGLSGAVLGRLKPGLCGEGRLLQDTGDAVWFRNGLLDGRLRVRPGEGLRSAGEQCMC